MEGRCAVETLAEFGVWTSPGTLRMTLHSETYAFICSGTEEIYVFNTQEKKLMGILQFPTSVNDLAESDDKQHLFVASRSAVYCVDLPLVLSKLSAPESSSPTEIQITSEDLVITEQGVLCVLTVGPVFVTLSQRDTFWLLTVYKTGCYKMLNVIKLPVVSTGLEETKAHKRSPVMMCVHLSDMGTSSSDRHGYLEPTLFKLLFGLDAALIKSPVIVCGLPDGRLYSLPLRLPGMQVHVLHSLEEPVVFVGASVVMETHPGQALSLVAVGEHGRVVVIKTCKGATEEEGRQVSFAEGCVLGPVTSACVDKQCLYLSTGSDLLSLTLTEDSSGEAGQSFNNEATSKARNTLQSPISFNVSRLIALARHTAGQHVLLGLSGKGQLQKIVLPSEKDEASTLKHQTTHMGRSVKDLLSAIGDVCERASALKTAVKSRNQCLQHLNQVLNVSFLLMDSVEKPVRCHATTMWTRLLLKDSLHLTCILENSSPYSLEQGWTLNVTVIPLTDSSQEQNSSYNYSFPLCSLHPGQRFDVTLPLTVGDGTLFPITVSCVLVFSLRALLDEEQLARLPQVQNSTISLPLNTLSVDWLHALRLNPLTIDKDVTAQSKICISTDTIQDFLKSRRTNKNVERVESKQHSVSVKVSSDLLKDILVSSNVETTKTSTNLCTDLLDWLLSKSHRGVEGHQWDSAATSTVVYGKGPNGHLVKLNAREVIVGVEESMAIVEVEVESQSLATVCGLHHAILDRIHFLAQRTPKKNFSFRIESIGLRPALQRAEHLLQQIRDTRVSGALGVGVSSGQMTRSLLKVYQELRENPLVIF